MTITSQRTMVSRYVPEDIKGAVFGVYYLYVGTTFLVTNLALRFLWDSFDSQVAFGHSIFTTVVVLILLIPIFS